MHRKHAAESTKKRKGKLLKVCLYIKRNRILIEMRAQMRRMCVCTILYVFENDILDPVRIRARGEH